MRVTAHAANLKVEVEKAPYRGAWTPPYTQLQLVLPPGDTRSFYGAAFAPITPA